MSDSHEALDANAESEAALEPQVAPQPDLAPEAAADLTDVAPTATHAVLQTAETGAPASQSIQREGLAKPEEAKLKPAALAAPLAATPQPRQTEETSQAV